MKRKFIIKYCYALLVFVLVLSMCACGKNPADPSNTTEKSSVEESKSEDKVNEENKETSKEEKESKEETKEKDNDKNKTEESKESSVESSESKEETSESSSEEIPEETFQNVVIDENGEKKYQFEEGSASDIKFVNETPDEERALNVIQKLNRAILCYRDLTFNPNFYDIYMQYDTEQWIHDSNFENNPNFTTKDGTPFTETQVSLMPNYYYHHYINEDPTYKGVYDTFSEMTDKEMKNLEKDFGDLDFPLCSWVCQFSAYLNKCKTITVKEINTIYKNLDGSFDTSIMEDIIFGEKTKIEYQAIIDCDGEKLESLFDKNGNMLYLYYWDDSKEFTPITVVE